MRRLLPASIRKLPSVTDAPAAVMTTVSCTILRPYRVRRGFTLVELLVVVAVIAVLAALLMPALSRATEMAKRASCMNNQKQLTVAFSMYTSDTNGFFQPRTSNDYANQVWNGYLAAGQRETSHGVLARYMGNSPDAFFCPSTYWADANWHNRAPNGTRKSWGSTAAQSGMSAYGISSYTNGLYAMWRLGSTKLEALKRPPAVFADALFTGNPPHGGSDGLFLTNPAMNHNYGGVNAAKPDGSVKWWNISMIYAVNAATERNTFANMSMAHGGADNFWSLVSGFNLPGRSVY